MSLSLSPPPKEAPEGSLPIALGELVAGKYRVDQLLGRGGMAVVMAGIHIELDAPIAVKVLLPARAKHPEAVRRFLTEARAAAKLTSGNVARISDVGTTETAGGDVLPFIVMERLDGVDLATLMETRKRLPVDEAVDMIRQACLGLGEAHALKIVHRDIKPANLFLTRSRDGAPVVKVLDFGISKTLSESGKNERVITADAEVMGSPGYMSPEQVRADKSIDERTDIWSLGVVLHEMISGKEAFAGEALHEIYASILHADPTPLQDDIPADVQAIVRRCLQKAPERRYQTIGELTHDLARAIDRPAGLPTHAFGGRRPVLAVAGAAALLVASGIALFGRGHSESDGATTAALSLKSAVAVPSPPPPPPPAPVAAPPSVEPAVSSAPSVETPKPSRPATRTPPVAAPQPSASTPAAPSATPPATRKRTDW